MINYGYAYQTANDAAAHRIVAITAVNPRQRTAAGMTRERTEITIDCSHPVGGLLVTPSVGEQWYVQRFGLIYTLLRRLPANSAAGRVEVAEGQVQVGSTGPLTLHGSEVQVDGPLRLGSTLYRDRGGVLERSTDEGVSWVEVSPPVVTAAPSAPGGSTGQFHSTLLDATAQNGSTVMFPLPFPAAVPSQIEVYRNGLREVFGVGFTATAAAVTFTTAPLSSDSVVLVYQI